MNVQINAVNRPSHEPLLLLKQQLVLTPIDAKVSLLVDSSHLLDAVEAMAKTYDYNIDVEQENEHLYRILITKNHAYEGLLHEKQLSDSVVVFAKDFLGDGDLALGKILIKSYLYALCQSDTLPKAVIMLNAGVKLACADANTIDDLQYLVANGVKVMSCGTCLNFYGLESSLNVGIRTDMFHIVQEMNNAGKVVSL